jgi:DNA-binding IclR family transcriptional regulator
VHCTALGKAIIAYMPADWVSALSDSGAFFALTHNTITSAHLLLEELALIRQRGYSVDMEENAVGVKCIGAPIFNGQNAVIGAVSVSGPAHRIGECITQGMISEDIVSAARAISERLGYDSGVVPKAEVVASSQ